MADLSKLAFAIKQVLQKKSIRPNQASAAAYELFLLRDVFGYSHDKVVHDLLSDYHRMLLNNNIVNLAANQANYAIKIAGSGQELLYEEMHKLFSLCDEVHALNQLGYPISPDLGEIFEKSVRGRFSREQKKARMVAEDKFEPWKKELWWYKECLS